MQKGLQIGLILIGLTASLGYCLNSLEIMGLGKLTLASPLPLVFTGRNGIEDFESEHRVSIVFKDGSTYTKMVTQEDVRKIVVPFSRFNIYMGSFALMTLLPEKPWHSVIEYGYCNPGVMLETLGIDKTPAKITIDQIRKVKHRSPSQWQKVHNCRQLI